MNDHLPFDLGIGFTCDEMVPLDKWQGFKERWLPWLAKWFPVIRKPVNLRVYEVSAIPKGTSVYREVSK